MHGTFANYVVVTDVLRHSMSKCSNLLCIEAQLDWKIFGISNVCIMRMST